MNLVPETISCDDAIFVNNLSKELLKYIEFTDSGQKSHKIIEKVNRRLTKDEWARLSRIIVKYNLPVAIFINGLFGGHISLHVFSVDYQNINTIFWLEIYFENMPIVDDDFMLLDERGRMQNAYCSWLELLKSEGNVSMIEKYNLPPTRDFEWYVDWL